MTGGGTLTVSKVEQRAVLEILTEERGKLSHSDLDGIILDSVCKFLTGNTTIGITRVEATVVVRHLRLQRDRMAIDLRALEERRLRGGYNGTLDAAHRVLDAECMLVDDVLRRLWAMI